MKTTTFLASLSLLLCACELNFGGPEDSALDTDADADADADADTDTDADADADADTDADTDADADSDADSDADTDCEWEDDAEFTAQDPDPGQDFSPSFFSVTAIGLVHDSDLYDFTYDGEDSSSYVMFTFHDSEAAGYADLCDVIYDFSAATPFTTAWGTSSGAELWDGFDLVLSGGATDCGVLDSGQWGTTDVRDLIERWQWGIGWGDMVDIKADLKDAVIGAGLDWQNDWEPYVLSGYLYWDLAGSANEWMYGFGFDTSCDEAIIDSAGDLSPLPVPTAKPLETGLWEALPFYILDAGYLAH